MARQGAEAPLQGRRERVWAALPGSGWLVSHTVRQETPCRGDRPTAQLDGEKGIE